jgi:hypothetical protein
MTEESKQCKGKCKQVKPLVDFHKKSQTKDGREHECKKCKNEKSNTYRKLRNEIRNDFSFI